MAARADKKAGKVTGRFEVDAVTGDSNRLSGTFDARHPDSLLLWSQSRDDLVVEKRGDAYVISSP